MIEILFFVGAGIVFAFGFVAGMGVSRKIYYDERHETALKSLEK